MKFEANKEFVENLSLQIQYKNGPPSNMLPNPPLSLSEYTVLVA